MLRNADDIIGMRIRATDGDVGHVYDLYFDDEHWSIRYLVVDTGSIFGGRKVLLAPVVLTEPLWDDGILNVDLTQDQVEGSPDIDLEKPVSRQQLTALHDYYAWPVFWGPGYWAYPTAPGYIGAAYPVAVENTDTEAEEKERENWDPDLRSAREVAGYDIQATDGGIGHVTDFIIDDETFIIRYLNVDTTNWLGGRHVIIAPRWIGRIDWAGRDVYVDLTRDEVANAPEYDPDELIDRDYEVKVYEHYHRPGYWADHEHEH